MLGDLRARRYRPAAWWRFVADSFDRAAAQRAFNARAHRETLAVGALGLGAWCVAAPWHPAGAAAGAAWWLLVVAMLDWHLGMLEHPDGQPLGRIGLPNLLGLGRLAIVPVVPLVPPWAVAGLLLVSGATDIADGRIARRRGQATRLGRWLDGAADAAVLIAATVALTASGELPVWAAGLVVARHAAQWVAVTLAYLVRGGPAATDVVPARFAGAVLLAGLVASPLSAAVGTSLVSIGALGGLVAVAESVRRVMRHRAPGRGRGPSASGRGDR